ncbi:SDR family NAD(P)-dependent oxidoreductase [Limobrevibacterium gyesilva]|uniref:SDR family NAD(P)-dependent oxidoreductase n=1 Tax=Limobrevibacterium gyesilva TaxID=2991712 RepID=A0AA41YM80_9PROT|nr:SDR family NAD(P)-dependent oxidoreductase [Limobrevibacterium gyesilva]MCW3473048.1 SDR family NAD(P)-dependent oxidoreductase [Limobrevibacterium gyesilva]
MLDPNGRVVMVSGAARGIGRHVVERLVAAGFQVSAGVRSARGLTEGGRLMLHPYEAESLEAARDWVAATVSRFGRLDGLVNAAGINPAFAVIDEDETALDRMWAVNVKGPLRLIRFALPHLKASGTGRVINVASLSGKRVRNANVGYAMSKFAVVALTHGVRHDGWDQGVRATALCPGFVATDMTAAVTKVSRTQMTDPADLAVLVEMLLRLPNNASVAELLVNCQHEDTL